MTKTVAMRSAPNAVQAMPTEEPRMTPMLRSAVDAMLNPHPDIRLQVEPLPPHVQVEARTTAARYEALCTLATPEQVMALLWTINAAVRNPQDRDGMRVASKPICDLVTSEIPASVITQKTHKAAIAKFQFWPSAAEIFALLREEAAPLLRKRDALRRVLAPDVEAPPREPPGDAERAAVSDLVQRIKAELADVAARRQAVEEASRPARIPRTSGHLSDDALRRLRDNDPRVRAARQQQRTILGKEGAS